MKHPLTILAIARIALFLTPMAASSADSSNTKALDRQWVALGEAAVENIGY